MGILFAAYDAAAPLHLEGGRGGGGCRGAMGSTGAQFNALAMHSIIICERLADRRTSHGTKMTRHQAISKEQHRHVLGAGGRGRKGGLKWYTTKKKSKLNQSGLSRNRD